MSDAYDLVYERLRQLKETTRALTIIDFASLGLSGNKIAECLQHFDSLGTVEMVARSHESSRDNRGADQVVVKITQEGRAELSTCAKSN